MLSSYKRLGDYIRLVDERNRNLEVETLLGLSMTKQFRKSTSNVVGTDMSKYKIVRKDRFACDFMSVIRVFKLPVVLQTSDDPILVSPAYAVFEVIDENILLPEYLMMWFRRDEFDRYCFFKCDSAVRGGFNWEELCDTQLPVPSIEKQKEIIAEYEAVEQRIRLNNTLCEKLEETAQTLYRHWFEDFEFPYSRHCEERGTSDEAISLNALPKVAESSAVYKRNNSPDTNAGYKSSGGEMVYSEELGKEIPKGWRVGTLGNEIEFYNGKAKPANYGNIPAYGGNGILDYVSDHNHENVVVIGRVGAYCGSLYLENGRCWITDNAISAISANIYYSFYLLSSSKLNEKSEGTGQPLITQQILKNIQIVQPPNVIKKEFNRIAEILQLNIMGYKEQNQKFEELKSLLLGKMAVEG